MTYLDRVKTHFNEEGPLWREYLQYIDSHGGVETNTVQKSFAKLLEERSMTKRKLKEIYSGY